jgi:hypothetical protein
VNLKDISTCHVREVRCVITVNSKKKKAKGLEEQMKAEKTARSVFENRWADIRFKRAAYRRI